MNASQAKIDRFADYVFFADGFVFSLIKRKTLKPVRMGEYFGLQLRDRDGVRRKVYVHRVICEAFCGPPPEGAQCRHINGDRHDNRRGNLAWGTPAENAADKVRHGTHNDGERNAMAKLTADAVNAMRKARAETGMSYAKIAKNFEVSTMTAFRAISGQSWRHTND